MELELLNIVSAKTTDPRERADLEELRRYAMAVAEVEEEQVRQTGKHILSRAVLEDIEESEDARERVFIIQSRFCERAESASEAVASIIDFEREELQFLHLLADLASQSERSRLQPLIETKEQLVGGMEHFLQSWPA